MARFNPLIIDTTGQKRNSNPGDTILFDPATIASASINISSSLGVNVAAPISGDTWWNGTNLYFYNGITNIDLLAGTLLLQVDGIPNVSQTVLNLISGTNINLTDNGVGGVTIDATDTITGLTGDFGGTTTGSPVTLSGLGGIVTTRVLDVITIDGSGVLSPLPNPITDGPDGLGGVVSVDWQNRVLNDSGSRRYCK